MREKNKVFFLPETVATGLDGYGNVKFTISLLSFFQLMIDKISESILCNNLMQ